MRGNAITENKLMCQFDMMLCGGLCADSSHIVYNHEHCKVLCFASKTRFCIPPILVNKVWRDGTAILSGHLSHLRSNHLQM
jgi:hypothetical protein